MSAYAERLINFAIWQQRIDRWNAAWRNAKQEEKWRIRQRVQRATRVLEAIIAGGRDVA